MLTILLLLLLLWAIGFLGGYGAGLTNLFLGGAIVLFLLNVFSIRGFSREGSR